MLMFFIHKNCLRKILDCKHAFFDLLLVFLISMVSFGCWSSQSKVILNSSPHHTTTNIKKSVVGVLPFDPNRSELYTREELWEGYDSIVSNNTSLDWRIFKYFQGKAKYRPELVELRAQRRHDTAMDNAINRFIDSTPVRRRTVIVLGSHAIFRDDPWYAKSAHLGYELARNGYFVVTGGGPGVMEAVHLGAWMSHYSQQELDRAIAILAETSHQAEGSGLKQYEMPDYWSKAKRVITNYPNGGESLGIPTWFYGHEGANAFSTHVAKYFSNALREEKICSIGMYGAIFAPGGPGTIQEAMMKAAENGYASYNWYGPMIFFNKRAEATMMKNLIDQMTTPEYRSLSMTAVDTELSKVIEFLKRNPPVHRQKHKE